jgi:hypothetical protein
LGLKVSLGFDPNSGAKVVGASAAVLGDELD